MNNRCPPWICNIIGYGICSWIINYHNEISYGLSPLHITIIFYQIAPSSPNKIFLSKNYCSWSYSLRWNHFYFSQVNVYQKSKWTNSLFSRISRVKASWCLLKDHFVYNKPAKKRSCKMANDRGSQFCGHFLLLLHFHLL